MTRRLLQALLGSVVALGVPGCTSSPSQTPSPSQGTAVHAVSYHTEVVPILKNRCAECHVTGGRGPFAMFDASGHDQYDVIKQHISDMNANIKTGFMPLGKGPLPASESAVLQVWEQQGAADN